MISPVPHPQIRALLQTLGEGEAVDEVVVGTESYLIEPERVHDANSKITDKRIALAIASNSHKILQMPQNYKSWSGISGHADHHIFDGLCFIRTQD